MKPYHKIQTVYLRDPDNNYKTLLEGQFAKPEFEYLADNEWVFTEKVDGTNIRVYWDLERVQIGGRTDKAQIPTFLYDRLQTLFPAGKLYDLYPNTKMTLYGEGYGNRIQKAGKQYIPDGVGFILFDVMIGDVYLERHNVEDIAANLGIPVVPTVGRGTLYDAVDMVKNGLPSQVGDLMAEGLVIRPAVELMDRMGRRIITKVKHKDFT